MILKVIFKGMSSKVRGYGKCLPSLVKSMARLYRSGSLLRTPTLLLMKEGKGKWASVFSPYFLSQFSLVSTLNILQNCFPMWVHPVLPTPNVSLSPSSLLPPYFLPPPNFVGPFLPILFLPHHEHLACITGGSAP